MKIYTKSGDKGETSLLGGDRVKKYDLRINAYGTSDELNSWIGLIKDQPINQSYHMKSGCPIFFLMASPISKILFGIFSLSFFLICFVFKLNIWSNPEKPVSKETKAF